MCVSECVRVVERGRYPHGLALPLLSQSPGQHPLLCQLSHSGPSWFLSQQAAQPAPSRAPQLPGKRPRPPGEAQPLGAWKRLTQDSSSGSGRLCLSRGLPFIADAEMEARPVSQSGRLGLRHPAPVAQLRFSLRVRTHHRSSLDPRPGAPGTAPGALALREQAKPSQARSSARGFPRQMPLHLPTPVPSAQLGALRTGSDHAAPQSPRSSPCCRALFQAVPAHGEQSPPAFSGHPLFVIICFQSDPMTGPPTGRPPFQDRTQV